MSGTVELLIQLRKEAKQNKEWATADKIRDELNALGIELKDTKDGVEWNEESLPHTSPKGRNWKGIMINYEL